MGARGFEFLHTLAVVALNQFLTLFECGFPV